MILDTNIPSEANKARVYFEKLVEGKGVIELKKVARRRTISQNSYVHKLFALWGMEYGYTTEEAKQVVKMRLGYTYQKSGMTFLVKTSDMDSKELTVLIDRFRNMSASDGFYLPSAHEFSLNHAYYEQQVERAIAMEKRYGY